MSLILTALQLLLAGCLIWAAAAKVLQADEFVGALRLSHLPEPVVNLLAIMIPVVEVGLGVWLLVAPPPLLPMAFWLCGGLFAGFTLWMGWILLRGLRVRCGCFGPDGGHVSARTIARNAGLMALAVVGAGVALRSGALVYDRSVWWVLTVLAAALMLFMIAALRFALPHLTLSDAQLR